MDIWMDIKYRIEMDCPLANAALKSVLVQADDRANRIVVELVRHGQPVSLDGASAVATFTRADGAEVRNPATVEGNAIFAPLQAESYSVPGSCVINVKMRTSGGSRTVLRLTGYVERSGGGVVVDPTGSIPSYDDLARIMEELQQGLSAAGTATERADTAAQNADAKAQQAEDAALGADGAAQRADAAANSATEAGEAAMQKADEAATAAVYIEGTTVSAHKLAPGSEPTAEASTVEGHLHIEYGLVTGDKGEQGPGYTIKGPAYATVEALAASVTAPEEGDQYNVGIAPPYNIYRWTGLEWEDQGALQGPPGADGAPGPGVATGGSTGQVLTKAGDADFDTEWKSMPAVEYEVQTLTEGQKAQARENVGAVGIDDVDHMIKHSVKSSTGMLKFDVEESSPLHKVTVYGRTEGGYSADTGAGEKLTGAFGNGEAVIRASGNNVLEMKSGIPIYPQRGTLNFDGADISFTTVEGYAKIQSWFYLYFISIIGDRYGKSFSVPTNTKMTLSLKHNFSAKNNISVYGVKKDNEIILIKSVIAPLGNATITFDTGSYDKITFYFLPDNSDEVYATQVSYYVKDIQLEPGESATAYQAYQGSSVKATFASGLDGIPVTKGGNFTDESGQAWLCDTIEAVEGSIVKRTGRASADSLTFAESGSGTGSTKLFSAKLPAPLNAYVTDYRAAISDKVPYAADVITGNGDGFCVYSDSLYVRLSGVSTVDALKSRLSEGSFLVALEPESETAMTSSIGYSVAPTTVVLLNANESMTAVYTKTYTRGVAKLDEVVSRIGESQYAYKTVAAQTGEMDLIDMPLEAGHTYILVANLQTSLGDNSINSLILKTTGNEDSNSATVRGTMQNGGGILAVTFAKITDPGSKVIVQSYKYSSQAFEYRVKLRTMIIK